jgi:hypothetical protein
MHETIARLYNLAGAIAMLMVLLLCFGAIMTYLDHRKTKVNDLYQALKADISDKNRPEREDLERLKTFTQLRKEQPEFQRAVHEKLKAYDIVPTSIEKTMSPVQLYQANKPLWISGTSIRVIKNIFILENKLGKDVIIAEHADAFE